MRLGVNARRLAGQRLGVARYIEYLLKSWVDMILPEDRIRLFIRESLDGPLPSLSDRFEVAPLRPHLSGLLWENVVLASHSRDMDVLFCPSYSMPLAFGGRCVLAIHSVNEVQSGAHPWWYDFTYAQIYRLSAAKADVVIVPSHSTKQDLQVHYRIPEAKIEVIPLGVDDAFRPVPDSDLLRSTRKRYLGTDRPFVLFVGKLSLRRNIPTLLTAFASLKKRTGIPHSLLLVGPNHVNLPLTRPAADLGITESLIQIDGRFSEHRELAALYNAADLYVNPSLYEGFSLPLVEAMACGLPAVVADRAALSEIADGSALMVKDPTAEALADAMERALADHDLRQQLRSKGLMRARAFRWTETARRTLEVLRHVAEGRGARP